jgi:uncharacterized membrane protein YkgB
MNMNLKQISIIVARGALFIVYFWFGFLKVIGQSPASEMVRELLSQTMPFMSLFVIHILTTILPLFLLPSIWTHMFVPTLEGQYIIKNLALIACVLHLYDEQSIVASA